MRRHISKLISLALLLVLIITLAACSFDEISISEFKADEMYFICGEEAVITFTAEINGKANDVKLYKDNDEVVGLMRDDGKDGDLTANDGVYTYELKNTVEENEYQFFEYYCKTKKCSSDKITIYYFAKMTEQNINKAKEEYNNVHQIINTLQSKYSDEQGHIAEKDEVKIINEIQENVQQWIDDGIVSHYAVEGNSIYI